MADELYIGYESRVPPAVAVRVRRVVPTLIVVTLASAVLVLTLHERLRPSRFDYGRPHEVRGTLRREPYPVLELPDRRVWLVGQGKHGAEATLGATPDGPIQLQGATIARGRHEMLEVVPGSVASIADPPVAAAPYDSGSSDPGQEVTLTGEVVDSKCFLGVMNPGEGTVHRDCARLCLRGGIPPMLLVRDEGGQESLVLLVSRDGRAIGAELAHLAGQAVALRGRLTAKEPIPTLWVTPSDLESLTSAQARPSTPTTQPRSGVDRF